jgi:hypothetical protein
MLNNISNHPSSQNPKLPKMASISMIPVPKVSCILQIKMVVKPGHREAWLALFKQIFNHVSQEPECAYFIVGEDEPGVFRWTEGWTKDKSWINEVLLFLNISKARLTSSRSS